MTAPWRVVVDRPYPHVRPRLAHFLHLRHHRVIVPVQIAVCTLLLLLPLAAAAPHVSPVRCTKHEFHIAVLKERLEHVEWVTPKSSSSTLLVQALGSKTVVLGARVGVGQHFVRFRDFTELFLRFVRHFFVAVRVPPLRLSAVRGLDRRVIGIGGHAQRVVVLGFSYRFRTAVEEEAQDPQENGAQLHGDCFCSASSDAITHLQMPDIRRQKQTTTAEIADSTS